MLPEAARRTENGDLDGYPKRFVDLACAVVAAAACLIPMIAIGVLVRMSSPGPALHWSKRVGKNNRLFSMAKFRTMRIDTPTLATHLLKDAARYVTPVGRFLRKTSLDELPQLINVIRGDMSLVGPRPALFNQDDLMRLRSEQGVHMLRPGLTGWAQVNGRDELSIPAKVECDKYYLDNRSLWLDVRILTMTFCKVAKGKGVSH